MLSIICIAFISIILIRQYGKNYHKAVYLSIFLLLTLPKNMSIELTVSLPSITVHRVIILLMFINWVLNYDKKNKNKIQFKTHIILILISTLISAFISENKLVSIKQYAYFLGEAIIFYVILVTSIKEEKRYENLIIAVSLGLTIVAILGFLERYTAFTYSELFGSRLGYEFVGLVKGGRKNIEVGYSHRILFGEAMVLGTFCGLFLNTITDKYKKRTCTIIILLNACAIYFCRSRGPWVAFILGNFIIAFTYYKPILKKVIYISTFALLVLLLNSGVRESITRLVSSTFDPSSVKGSSYDWRYKIAELAINEVNGADSLSNSLFGYGQGSHLFRTYPAIETSTGVFLPAFSWDNEYAVLFLEFGYIGFILIVSFYAKVLFKGYRTFIAGNKKDPVILLSVILLVVIYFMKSNVKSFSPQLLYIEYLSIGIIGMKINDRLIKKKEN